MVAEILGFLREAGGGWALFPGNEGQNKRKWPQVLSGLNFRENFFIERIVQHWHSCLGQ